MKAEFNMNSRSSIVDISGNILFNTILTKIIFKPVCRLNFSNTVCKINNLTGEVHCIEIQNQRLYYISSDKIIRLG